MVLLSQEVFLSEEETSLDIAEKEPTRSIVLDHS